MKPRILVLITVTITLAALAIPDRLQVQGQSQRQLHYTVTDLGNLGGNSFDEGIDINNQGQVAGFSSLAGDTTFHSFLWTEDNGIQDLGTLPGDVSSYASGINNKGQVVGASNDATGNSHGFLWKNGVMTDLNTLIPASSPLYLPVASQINSRGEIVGLALQTSTGQAHGFLPTPCDEEYVDKKGCAGRAERAIAVHGGPKVTVSEKVRKLLRQRLGNRYRTMLDPVAPTD